MNEWKDDGYDEEDGSIGRRLREFTPDPNQHEEALATEGALSKINPLELQQIRGKLSRRIAEALQEYLRELGLGAVDVGAVGGVMEVEFPASQDADEEWDPQRGQAVKLISAKAIASDKMMEARLRAILSTILPECDEDSISVHPPLRGEGE